MSPSQHAEHPHALHGKSNAGPRLASSLASSLKLAREHLQGNNHILFEGMEGISGVHYAYRSPQLARLPNRLYNCFCTELTGGCRLLMMAAYLDLDLDLGFRAGVARRQVYSYTGESGICLPGPSGRGSAGAGTQRSAL